MKNQDIFKRHPKMTSYFETSDGVKFFTNHHAKGHAKSLGNKDVVEVKKKNLLKVSKPVKSSDLTSMQKAKLRAEYVKKLDNIEDVNEALKGETASTVLKAGEDRIAELKALDLDSDTGAVDDTGGVDPSEKGKNNTENNE